MKYVCPKCESSDVAMMVDSWLNPNADDGSKFLSFVDSGYDNIFDGRAFRDRCNSCGWEQTGESERLEVKENTNEAK
jgi:hypothetical protein